LRVLLVMVEPPLPFGNAAARWFYVLLKGLVERGHAVTAFAACSKPAEMDEARARFPSPAYDLRLYPFPNRSGLGSKWETLRRPYSYMFGPDLKADLARELAAGFDVLHLEQLWCGWVGLEHASRALINVHHLVWIDLSESAPASFRERVERALMFRAERTLLRAFPHIRSSTPRLERPIREVNPVTEVETVPIGLDASLYPFIPDDRRSPEPTVTLIGSMAWYPGLSAARRLLGRLWPDIKRRVPAAKLEVVGWSARSALKEFLDSPDVSIAENVPDARPYFERANVFVYAPSCGSGMKIKVLEAMAFGVPVVTTSEGVEGLPAVDGKHAGVCEEDAGLIDRVVALLTEPERQNRQRRAARALVESHCGPGPTVAAIEARHDRIARAAR
jgi:glycosyltransferase involved in cell wall biosynthesis